MTGWISAERLDMLPVSYVADYEAMVREMYRTSSSTELLEGCLERIQRGWAQGTFADLNDNVCIIGGLNTACHGGMASAGVMPEVGHRNFPAFNEALGVLHKALVAMANESGWDPESIARLDDGNPLQWIPWFNDRESTTYEDAALLVKRAIELSKEEDEEA